MNTDYIIKRTTAALVCLELAEKHNSKACIGQARQILREIVNKVKENEQ